MIFLRLKQLQIIQRYVCKMPGWKTGTADEVANVAELLMSDKGAFTHPAKGMLKGKKETRNRYVHLARGINTEWILTA